MYRISYDKTTKSAKVHRANCRHSIVSRQSKTSQSSDVMESKEDAIELALSILRDHIECGTCLSDHKCTEQVFG